LGANILEPKSRAITEFSEKKAKHGSLTFDFAADSRTLATKGTTYSSSYRVSSISAPCFFFTISQGQSKEIARNTDLVAPIHFVQKRNLYDK
jgi:hypothetical protein